MTAQQITQLKFNKLTEAQYEATTPVDNEFYITTDANYALDSEAVHKSGDEEISGVKTFSDEVVFNAIPVINGGKDDSTEGGEIHIACSPSGGWDRDTTIIDEVADGIRFFNFKNNQVYGYRFDLNQGYGLPSVRMVVNTWISGTQWYRVWNDGWIEQGGYLSWNGAWTTLTFNRPFTTTNYYINGGGYRSDSSPYQCMIDFKDWGTSSCSVWSSDDTTSNACVMKWYACGY